MCCCFSQQMRHPHQQRTMTTMRMRMQTTRKGHFGTRSGCVRLSTLRQQQSTRIVARRDDATHEVWEPWSEWLGNPNACADGAVVRFEKKWMRDTGALKHPPRSQTYLRRCSRARRAAQRANSASWPTLRGLLPWLPPETLLRCVGVHFRKHSSIFFSTQLQ